MASPFDYDYILTGAPCSPRQGKDPGAEDSRVLLPSTPSTCPSSCFLGAGPVLTSADSKTTLTETPLLLQGPHERTVEYRDRYSQASKTHEN